MKVCNRTSLVNGEVGKILRSTQKKIRAADAKEVGVGNPAEETYRYPNQILIRT